VPEVYIGSPREKLEKLPVKKPYEMTVPEKEKAIEAQRSQ